MPASAYRQVTPASLSHGTVTYQGVVMRQDHVFIRIPSGKKLTPFQQLPDAVLGTPAPATTLLSGGVCHEAVHLGGDLNELFEDLTYLGVLRAGTRNAAVSLEAPLRCHHAQARGATLRISNRTSEITLRRDLIYTVIACYDQSRDMAARSLQFYSPAGELIHRLSLTAQSDVDAWQALVDLYRSEQQPSLVDALRRMNRVMYMPANAGRSMPLPETSRAVDASLLYELMHIVADNHMPVRFSVGNVGGLQSASARPSSVERGSGGTVHVRDNGMQLRIDLDQAATAWLEVQSSSAAEGVFRLQGRRGEPLLTLRGEDNDKRWARLLTAMIRTGKPVNNGCRGCKSPCNKGRRRQFAGIGILQGA